MSLLDTIREVIQISQPYEAGDYVIVPTLFAYQSGQAVQAYIQGGTDSFVVSDGGGAIQSYVNAGGANPRLIAHLKDAVASHGLYLNSAGWVYRTEVSREQLLGYITLVAECSLWTEGQFLKRIKRTQEARDFKEDVNLELKKDSKLKIVRRKHIYGASSKQHVFDFSIEVAPQKFLVVDAVVPEPNSINSAVVAHLDLKQMSNPNLVQGIVYDDRASWSPSDLALLGVGAPTVPFTRMRKRLESLSAA